MLSLTASELPQFMACNGVIKMEKMLPFDPSNEAADEGNATHWYIEQVFNGANSNNLIGTKAPNGLFITGEMVENAKEYLNDILGKGNVEVVTSYESPLFKIRGRADYICYNNGKLVIADFKYGHKLVSPENNWTLISHAFGWLQQNHTAEINEVEFKIYQPRGFTPEGTLRTWTIDKSKLLNLFAVLNATLTDPANIVKTGTEQCYRCKSLSTCPAAQKAVNNAIDMSEVPFKSEIDNVTLSWILLNIDRALELLKETQTAYTDLALHRLKAGEIVENYSIQANIGNTAWNKDVNPDFIKCMTGVDITTIKLITPAQAKKAGLPEDFINTVTNRPNNGFKLVKVDENKRAKKLFGDKNEK